MDTSFTRSNFNKLLPTALYALCFLLISIHTQAQSAESIEYLSPQPGSKGNSIYTNIILRFKNPLATNQNFQSYIHIAKGNQEFPYQIISQNDPNKLVLKTLSPFPVQSKIEINLDAGIKNIHNESLSGAQYFFYTHSLSKIDGFVNENWQNIPAPVATPAGSDNNLTGSEERNIKNDISTQVPFRMTTSTNDPADFFFLGSMYAASSEQVSIVNGKGEYIFNKNIPYMGLDFKMHEDSTFSYAILASNPEDYHYILLNKNMQVTDTLKAGNGYLTDIHELVKDTKTGHHYLLAQRVVDVDMSKVVINGQAQGKVLDLIIQEIDQNNQVLFEWKCIDHLPLTDAVGVDLTSGGVIDYVHCNSIQLDSDTSLLLSSRHLCEVTRIDRRTGAIIWRLGPNASTDNFTFTNDAAAFTYQHNAQRLPNGNILLFDNGNFKVGTRYSRAVEYRLNETLLTAEKVWEYRHTPDIISDFMGSVQRLNNGNTVVGWGSNTPSFTEVDSLKHVVYEGTLPDYILNYRVFKARIPELIGRLQPTFNLPEPFEVCKLNGINFDKKVQGLIQPFIPSQIDQNFQLFNLSGNFLSLILEDTNTHFYSFHQRILHYKTVGLAQKDTTLCSGKGIYQINLNDACMKSSYLWNTGDTTQQINYKTHDFLNKIWVETRNGEQIQTDTIRIKVSPVMPFEVLGEPMFTKPFQVFTYSVPYYKGAAYEWKAINGNIVGGFDGNSVQVQWGNKPSSFLQGTITDTYGCMIQSAWDTISYNESSTGIEDLLIKTGVNVYPSPFNDRIQLDGTKAFTYALYNLNGQLLRNETEYSTGNKLVETDLLPSGIYLLKISTGEQEVRVKLVKE